MSAGHCSIALYLSFSTCQMSVEYSDAGLDGSPSSSDFPYALPSSPSPWLVEESMAAEIGDSFDWASLSPSASSSSSSWQLSSLSSPSPVVGAQQEQQLGDDELHTGPSASSSPTLPEPDFSQSADGSAVGAARPRFWSRKVACQVCHYSKARCDGSRPCERCVRLHHTAHCVDRTSKRRPDTVVPRGSRRPTVSCCCCRRHCRPRAWPCPRCR